MAMYSHIPMLFSNIRKEHSGIITMEKHSHTTATSQKWKWNSQELFPR